MVIDTSALIAILQKEPEAEAFTRAIFRDSRRLISVMTALEAEMVFSINCSVKRLPARSSNSPQRVGHSGDSEKGVIPPASTWATASRMRSRA